MTAEEKIDANLEKILVAAGSSLKYYTMQLTRDRLREAMQQIMSDSYIAAQEAMKDR